MKKTLSVLLAVCMLFVCIPFAANAEGIVALTNGTINLSSAFEEGVTYTVGKNVTVTIAGEIQFPNNATLMVEAGGILNVTDKLNLNDNSSLYVQSGGVLNVDGQVIGRSVTSLVKINGQVSNSANIIGVGTKTIETSAAFGSNTEYEIGSGENVTLSNDIYFPNHSSYIVKAGGRLTIDGNLHLLEGSKLIVEKDGILIVNGRVIGEDDSCEVELKGNVSNGQNIIGKGTMYTYIRFPNLHNVGMMADNPNGTDPEKLARLHVQICIADSSNITADVASEADGGIKWLKDSAFTEDSKPSAPTGTSDIYPSDENYTTLTVGKAMFIPNNGLVARVPLNTMFYIKNTLVVPGVSTRAYDNSLFKVFADNSQINSFNGVGHSTVTGPVSITYSPWIDNGNAFLKTYKIAIPEGDGYQIVDKHGEVIDSESLDAKYGTYFTFKVDVDEAYDMSVYQVYIYNGYGWVHIAYNTVEAVDEQGGITPAPAPDGTVNDNPITKILPDAAAQPDEYGYYTFKVEGEASIFVYGMVKNSTITGIGNVLDMIKSIVTMIRSFFGDFFAEIKAAFEEFSLQDIISGLFAPKPEETPVEAAP